MGLFDRFRKPKDTGQVSMDGAVDARSAGAARPSGTAQVAGAVGAVGAAGSATGEFRLPIADVFTIAGRGVVVVGQVAAGACRSGDAAVVVGADGASVVGDTTIVGIEAFRKRVDVARQGDMVGLMLRGVSREQVHAGDIVGVRLQACGGLHPPRSSPCRRYGADACVWQGSGMRWVPVV